MEADDLFALGERLAHPCLYLSEALPGEAIVGLWGDRAAPRSSRTRGEHVHWVSVPCEWLRAHGFPLEGRLSVYTSSAAEPAWLAVNAPGERLPFDTVDGIALSGHEGLALPHLDTIEASTGTTIDAMVCNGRIQPEHVAAYDKHWWNSTFNTGWITLGGWRMPWPEDDPDDDPLSKAFYEGDRRLVLRTFHDAEPWVDVWIDDDGKLEAIPRIT